MDFDSAMLLAIPASFLLFLGIEALIPSAREMPAVRHWRLIGLAGFAGTLLVYVGTPLLVVPLLPPMALVDLNGWGNWAALPIWVLTTFLGYWADPDDPRELRSRAYGPTYLPGSLSRLEIVERYAEKSGRPVGSVLFHYVFALFKIAAVPFHLLPQGHVWIGCPRLFQRRDRRRRVRGRISQNVGKDPLAPLHRRRPAGMACKGQDASLSEHAGPPFGCEIDAAKLRPLHARDAVVASQPLVEKAVAAIQQFINTAVRADNRAEEEFGLLPQV